MGFEDGMMLELETATALADTADFVMAASAPAGFVARSSA